MKKTVGIVIICHSNSMVEKFREFLEVLKQSDFEIVNGGGENYDVYGTTPEIVAEAIKKANRGAGVLVFPDLGSSISNAIYGKKLVKNEINVEIVDCPLIEGVISAVAANDVDMDLMSLKQIAEESRDFRKLK